MEAGPGRAAGAADKEAGAPSAAWIRYQVAVAEFDRLWETGASRLQPERMQALLIAIEAYEDAARAS